MTKVFCSNSADCSLISIYDIAKLTNFPIEIIKDGILSHLKTLCRGCYINALNTLSGKERRPVGKPMSCTASLAARAKPARKCFDK